MGLGHCGKQRPSSMPFRPPTRFRMTKQPGVLPRWATVAIKLARFGECQDEWEGFFQSQYEDKLRRYGEQDARRWAYRHAAKTLFFAALEWCKLAMIIYSRFAGR
jgi:hypothetical protein